MNKAQQIEEMARTRAGCGKADCLSCKLHRGGLCSSYANASAAYAAGYRKQEWISVDERLPTAEENYCQNFMMQIEQSTFDKIANKEINWNFSDLEEDGIRDMMITQENTYLFGAKNKIYHPTKDGMITWFTNGIWYMAGKDIEVGEWDDEKNR